MLTTMHRWSRVRLFGALCVAVLLAVPSDGVAQGADTAARVATEIERRIEDLEAEARLRTEGPGVLTDPIERAELPPPGGPTFPLRDVVFTPESAFLSDAQLDRIAARYVGQSVDFRQISMLIREVNDLYAEKGVVTAAAILQPQDLGTGTLTVTLVEGQVGVVAVAGAEDLRQDFIFNRVRIARGTTVDVPTASEDIARFNQTHRAQLRLLLQPGAAFGTTDLVFGVTEPPRHFTQAYIDNSGQESTGEVTVGAIYRRYGLLGIDDTLLVFLEGARGSRAGTLRYDFPVGEYGTRVSLSHTQTRTRVIAGETEELRIRGRAQSTSLLLSHPFRADDQMLVSGTFSVFRGTNRSTSADMPLVDTRTLKFAPGLRAAYSAEDWRAEGQMQLVRATVQDRILDERARYNIITGSAQASYRFRDDLTLVGRGGFQWTRADLLPGSLLFQIGGPTTVRGYPSEGIAGDRGFYGNIELYRPFDAFDRSHDGFGFLDFGRVYSTFPSVTSMASAGLGVAFGVTENVRLELTAAVPLRRAVSNQSNVTLSAALVLTRF